MTMFDLERFVEAQTPIFGEVRKELGQGLKTSHWMWFVFPQLKDLGFSSMAQHYGLESLGEARAYLQHPVLGPRLIECCRLLTRHQRPAVAIFGEVDSLKLCSCLTLFERAAPRRVWFPRLLEKYFGGERDPVTLASPRLRQRSTPGPRAGETL